MIPITLQPATRGQPITADEQRRRDLVIKRLGERIDQLERKFGLSGSSATDSAVWPGFFWFRSVRFYDSTIDTEDYGTAITGSRARWVKVTIGASYAAEYFSGPVPSGSWPANTFYFDTENPQCFLPF